MKRMLIYSIILIIVFLFLGLYFLQEKLIFYPEKLPADYEYSFSQEFQEINYSVEKGVKINALHFKTRNPKGVVFYSHGNAGSLRSWGLMSGIFARHQFDLLIYDYRGYGKSTGKITEQNLYHDADFIYNDLLEKYEEQNIIVYGRSIGTGVASYVASTNNPGFLILESPYFNLSDLTGKYLPFIPNALLKFKFRNNLYIPKVSCPICIFHGTEDEIIYHGSSIKLAKLFKPEDRLISIKGGHHNDLEAFDLYHKELAKILSEF